MLTASGHELGSKEIYPSVSKAIYHGMLSAHPKKYYDVGSVSIKPLPFLPAVEMPLWCWRIMNDFFPESIMEFFGVSRALRHKNQNKKSTKKTSRRRTTSRSRRVKRPPTNTYEHLVMKNV